MQYRARETFLWRGRVVVSGEVVDASDPVVQRNLVLFVPIADPIVEQATAAPGERRTVRIKKGADRG